MKQKKNERKKRQKEFLKQIIMAGLRLSLLLIVAILVVSLSRELFRLGYDLFNERQKDGVEIAVEFSVTVGESAVSVAERLKEKEMISSEVVFLLQKIIYDKDIYAGVHQLHSNMTTLEILGVLSTPAEK
jgi:cell division protein YceG involved in septum cleavage